eukprot:353839-Chlamydomonas_euryale.AAC.12
MASMVRCKNKPLLAGSLMGQGEQHSALKVVRELQGRGCVGRDPADQFTLPARVFRKDRIIHRARAPRQQGQLMRGRTLGAPHAVAKASGCSPPAGTTERATPLIAPGAVVVPALVKGYTVVVAR